jgi:hypothetical protein
MTIAFNTKNPNFQEGWSAIITNPVPFANMLPFMAFRRWFSESHSNNGKEVWDDQRVRHLTADQLGLKFDFPLVVRNFECTPVMFQIAHSNKVAQQNLDAIGRLYYPRKTSVHSVEH